MTPGTNSATHSAVRPEEAFAILGNETRIDILRVLAEADAPMSFTALRKATGVTQGSQFNYHLRKVVGHFVDKTADGYELREPGRYIVEAVLAGAVSDGPVLEPTPVDFQCLFCDGTVEASYDDGTFRLHCPSCAEEDEQDVEELIGEAEPDVAADAGPVPSRHNLATVRFPPAGLKRRTPTEAMRAATTWVHLDALATSSGVCPRCAATVECTVEVCENHEGTRPTCPECGRYHRVLPTFDCTNCLYTYQSDVVMSLLAKPEILAFVGRNGLDVTTRGIEWGWDWDEEILDTDPFRGRYTFYIDDDTLTLTVDDEMAVVDSAEQAATSD